MSLNKDANIIWGPRTIRDSRKYPVGNGFSLPNSVFSNPDGQLEQDCLVALELQLQGYQQPADPTNPDAGQELYVVADLAGTMITPGTLLANDNENRGWFTHAIDVSMWFDKVFRTIDQDAPLSTPATGSQSSGSSESIGFFGDQLTATASQSSSGGRSYQDYEVTNQTSYEIGQAIVRHHLALSVCDAGQYREPFSLIDSKSGDLFGLPPRAIGNNPLTSAASFLDTVEPKEKPAKATLTIDIKHWLAAIVWANTPGMKPLVPSGDFDATNLRMVSYLWLDSGAYYAIPACRDSKWQVVIDFDHGGVVLAESGCLYDDSTMAGIAVQSFEPFLQPIKGGIT